MSLRGWVGILPGHGTPIFRYWVCESWESEIQWCLGLLAQVLGPACVMHAGSVSLRGEGLGGTWVYRPRSSCLPVWMGQVCEPQWGEGEGGSSRS